MKELRVTVRENVPVAQNVFRLTFSLPEPVEGLRCGRFVDLSVGDGAHLLRRPIAICAYTADSVTVCYQCKGAGTRRLAACKEGDALTCVLPLGNGFVLREEERRVALVGGGVGVFPMISVLKEYAGSGKTFYSYIGFRTKAAVCGEEAFRAGSERAVLVTDDGSFGEKKNAVEAFFDDLSAAKPDVILSCGPAPMLRALKAGLAERGVRTPCYVSLEERMGCGIGACLVCVCDLENGEHARVCKDGPVFAIGEVKL